MLYKKNSQKELSKELFKNPTAEYRGTPFWAWNNMLTKDELLRQIDVFKEMGLGGFHMHVRTGLQNTYLSDEYMQLVKDCVEKAKKENMLAWLYDEDRWPSGAAGGIVTKEPKYKARYLRFTPFAEVAEEGNILAVYDIMLDKNGYLASYKTIGKEEKAEGAKWYASLFLSGNSSWYNNQCYVDTLNPEALEKFIDVTHEKYKKWVGDEFDGVVPAIFTDEPQVSRKRTLTFSEEKKNIELPWTDKLPILYQEHYGADVFDTLPELFFDLPDGKISVARYRYHDFVAELFAVAFADTIGGWCDKNHIALTGHMMEEPTLRSQCAALGEAMRSYRGFGLPGIDMLCNRHEFTTAKQCQSAVHQYGREGMLSELYGVTSWFCDFRTYKHQGDWQAALGVTVRVPHLSWYAMAGEAKRDYPASIHYQSPWYQKYNLVEDHFARVNTVLTRGKPVVKVAVIHPIESYWLHWGPNDKSGLYRSELDRRFNDVTNWLLEGSIDFDFVSESLLPDLCKNGGAPLKVGEMQYDAVVVPGCETLRTETYERLNAFADKGGKLVMMGEAPYLCDAVPSDEGKKLAEKSVKIDFSRAALLDALEEERVLTVRFDNGDLCDKILYQMREDGETRWLFFCPDREPEEKDVDDGDMLNFIINGEWNVEVYDTENGEIKNIGVQYQNGNTVLKKRFFGYDSLLLKLTPGKGENAVAKENSKKNYSYVTGLVDYELSEKNVYLLDTAEYRLSGENEYHPAEEILRLDNICREKLGIPRREGGVAQPWAIGNVPTVDRLFLKFTFDSEIEVKDAVLALEAAENADITLNGEKVKNDIIGWYVDIAIDKVELPTIQKGTNVLEVSYPYGEKIDPENMFILGDFGVRVAGSKATLIALPEKIPFGNLTQFGFPFYGGNVTYFFDACAKNGEISLRVNHYRGAMVEVFADGKAVGDIIYPPYELTVNNLADGLHKIGLKLYIHRNNTFGPIHLRDDCEDWHGPGAWRSRDGRYSPEYHLTEIGIIAGVSVTE